VNKEFAIQVLQMTGKTIATERILDENIPAKLKLDFGAEHVC
jgi:hypothetical protein